MDAKQSFWSMQISNAANLMFILWFVCNIISNQSNKYSEVIQHPHKNQKLRSNELPNFKKRHELQFWHGIVKLFHHQKSFLFPKVTQVNT